MELMKEQDGRSLDIVGENLEALKTMFPEAFTEDGVNFDTLRQLLGNEVDDGEEKYGLNWHGKKKARQIALTPSMGTLRPCPEESVDWETTQNLFIEGDNLEVLKLLQKSYAGKVKMIYIDPPYNTGNEFIYPDRFQDNLDTYLKYTGQKGDEGFKFSSNTESSGRYHTNWLNMMYPRLKLARNLLCDDGLIAISISDVEISNLRRLCDDIFGEESLLVQLIWKSRQIVDSRNKNNASNDHEYIAIYSKHSDFSKLLGKEIDISKYSNPDDDPRGSWMSNSILGLANATQRPNLHYSITDPATGREFACPPDSGWRYSRDTMKGKIDDERIIFPNKQDGRPREKKYIAELSSRFTGFSSILGGSAGYTLNGSREVRDLLGGRYFDFPKPISLLKLLVTQGNVKGNEIILDFFAGSCTTAHSTFELNVGDGGNRKWIMVQLPEPCDEKSETFKAGYVNIAEIGKERIRRAAVKIKEDNADYEGDFGFKVFKLDSSNIRAWNPDRGDLEQTLLDHTEHLVEGRSEEDVLYELLLKRGVDLTVPIEEREISGKAVYSIGYGVLFACLDTAISRDEVEEIAQGIVAWHRELEPASDTQVVFRDSAFADDIAKTNMTAILEQNGIAHVRSL